MTQPELGSAIDLAEFYENVVVSDDLFTAVLTSEQGRVRQDLARLGHRIEKSAWDHVLPQEVTLAYHSALNKVSSMISGSIFPPNKKKKKRRIGGGDPQSTDHFSCLVGDDTHGDAPASLLY